jgi:hypothetical protein
MDVANHPANTVPKSERCHTPQFFHFKTLVEQLDAVPKEHTVAK